MTDTLELLQRFYAEKLNMLLQHQAGARLVGQYDVNNTYQYIVNRDDVQLSWVAKAIDEFGGALPTGIEPSRSGDGRKGDAAHRVIEEDGRAAQEFVDRWRPQVESMKHARHRSMLRVILGETGQRAISSTCLRVRSMRWGLVSSFTNCSRQATRLIESMIGTERASTVSRANYIWTRR